MVFVKVRETYDLHTVQNKMTVIGIHTPKPDIIKKNFPGLLMQCKKYRPVSCDVRLACASVLPLDPLGIGTEAGDVAPEDVFNPILYKAMSNKGMSQLEARLNAYGSVGATFDVNGSSASVNVDDFIDAEDDFNLYYGLLSEARGWKKANVQSGLQMSRLKPIVYDMLYNVGDSSYDTSGSETYGNAYTAPADDGSFTVAGYEKILGKPHRMPFINCTAYTGKSASSPLNPINPGFNEAPANMEQIIPWIRTFVGCIIVPPSRLHSLYFRCVIDWVVEFSAIRPMAEITDWAGLAYVGANTHYQNYAYESTKEAITGTKDSILESDSCMVSANVGVTKVM